MNAASLGTAWRTRVFFIFKNYPFDLHGARFLTQCSEGHSALVPTWRSASRGGQRIQGAGLREGDSTRRQAARVACVCI
eukprot:6214406-Pleurochrysis_carterae.AAC.1